MYLTPERALKIGMIIVVVSVIILGISVYGVVESEIQSHPYTVLGKNIQQIPVNVTAGALVTYSVVIKSNNTNQFTAWISEPSGNKLLESNFTGSGISESIVASVGGQWVLHVENKGTNSSVLQIHVGQITQAIEAGLYGGITALVVGLILIAYFFNMLKRQRVRQGERF